MMEVLSNITGFDPNPAIVTPILWILLFLLIAGSFACIEGLARAIRTRQVGQIVQMVMVELAVMFFEVVFLYRELVDAITPWIAQQTGGQLQLALVSILSRETISTGEAAMPSQLPLPGSIVSEAIAGFKKELEWFKAEGRHVAEVLSLPILQLFAVAVNFPVTVVRGDPIFRLPFQSLDDVLANSPLAVREGGAARRATA